MTLPSSGQITLANLQAEFGGSNPISLSEYYRGGAYVPNSSFTSSVPTSGAITLQNFRGTSNIFAPTITTNTADINLTSYLAGLGWNGVSAVQVTVAANVYIYSTSTARGAFYNIPACTIINNGFIMGKGGNGNGGAGGDALTLAGNISLINNSGGYIGGGGGGGARGNDAYFSGGCGGAGGGTGGVSRDGTGGGAGGSIGGSGGNGSNTGGGSGPVGGYGGTAGGGGGDWDYDTYDTNRRTGGGGGGRVLPGAASGYPNVGGSGYVRGMAGGGPNQVGEIPNYSDNGVGMGGGGWGAAGGSYYYAGGAGGKAIALNGHSCTLSGYTSQIYGAVA